MRKLTRVCLLAIVLFSLLSLSSYAAQVCVFTPNEDAPPECEQICGALNYQYAVAFDTNDGSEITRYRVQCGVNGATLYCERHVYDFYGVECEMSHPCDAMNFPTLLACD